MEEEDTVGLPVSGEINKLGYAELALDVGANPAGTLLAKLYEEGHKAGEVGVANINVNADVYFHFSSSITRRTARVLTTPE